MMIDQTARRRRRAGLFSRLLRSITTPIDRLRKGSTSYRPEKHYMRGSGPKSQHLAADKHSPNTT